MIEFNSASTYHVSYLFFGGSLKQDVDEPVMDDNGNFVLVKSGPKKGQIKTRKTPKDFKIRGLGIKPLVMWKTKRPGIYSTDDKTLKQIVSYIDSGANHATYSQTQLDGYKAAKLMLKIRDLNKQLSTYYESVGELIYPDGCIRGYITHVSTQTGRTSSANPNQQNVPAPADSEVKKHFTSRYGNEGAMMQIDYSQMEVVVEAQLSGDLNYIRDVLNGVDFHIKNLALKEGLSYEEVSNQVQQGNQEWIDKRKKIKGFTFVQQYGGGIEKTAVAASMEKEEVKELMQARKTEYPRLALYHEYLVEQVNKKGQYQTPLGRILKFKKYPCTQEWQLKKGILESYKPPEIINYGTQATATADISLIMMGKFWREKALHNRDKYLLVNFIHDALLLDVRKKYLQQAEEDVKVIEQVENLMKDNYNLDWIIPVKSETKVGDSWWTTG